MRQWLSVSVLVTVVTALGGGCASAQSVQEIRIHPMTANTEVRPAVPSRPLFMVPVSAPQVGQLTEVMNVPPRYQGVFRVTRTYPAGTLVQSTGYPNTWCAHERRGAFGDTYDACFIAENGAFISAAAGYLVYEPSMFTSYGQEYALPNPVPFTVLDPRPTGEMAVMYRLGHGKADNTVREVHLFIGLRNNLNGGWDWMVSPETTAPIAADGSAHISWEGLDIDFTGIDQRGRGSFRVNAAPTPRLMTVDMSP